MEQAAYFYLCFLLFFFFITFMLIPLTIRIKIDNWRKNNCISLEIKLLFFSIHRTYYLSKAKEFTSHQITASKFFLLKKFLDEQNYRQLLDTLLNSLPIFHRQLKKISWRCLDLKLKLGTGNPAETALIMGSLHGICSILSLYLVNDYSFQKQPLFLLYPSFTAKMLYFELFLEFKTSMVRLLHLGLYLRAYFFLGRWSLNAGTSNPGLNENSHGKFKRNGGC